MTLTWTKILLGALVAYIVYKMFFAREGFLDSSSTFGIVVAVILALLFGIFMMDRAKSRMDIF